MEQSTRMYEVELRVGDVDTRKADDNADETRKAAENADTKFRT